MSRILVMASVLVGIGGVVLAAAPKAEVSPAEMKKAQAAADAWLKLVDKEDVAASWKTASKSFQKAVTQAQWEQAMTAVRKPLGALTSRKLKSATPTNSLPGAPDGRYVVLQYDSSFERKQAAVETVTPMLDPDGQWRVSGYFIK